MIYLYNSIDETLKRGLLKNSSSIGGNMRKDTSKDKNIKLTNQSNGENE